MVQGKTSKTGVKHGKELGKNMASVFRIYSSKSKQYLEGVLQQKLLWKFSQKSNGNTSAIVTTVLESKVLFSPVNLLRKDSNRYFYQ